MFCPLLVFLCAFFQALYIAVVSICLICYLALWPTALQYQLPALLFVCFLLFWFLCDFKVWCVIILLFTVILVIYK